MADLYPIVVVSFGKNYKQSFTNAIKQWFAELNKQAQKRGFPNPVAEPLDLTKILTDPKMNLGHKENGRYPSTCRAIYAQAADKPDHQNPVIEVLSEILDRIIEKGFKVVPVFCNSSFHRADTSCRIVQDMLNSIVDEHGQQIYNCLHISFSEATGLNTVTEMIHSGNEWLKKPFGQPFEGPTENRYRYGYDFCRGLSTPWKGWYAVWSWFDTQYLSTATRSIIDEENEE